ncbi:hypothetical protein [Legionella fallonii]|uniref:Uncharacterized protein n=1 Tax=Legionella fallonii LLAP-10 TaxID=1212491 RepID=A0A098GBM8_9GAMM|nr:hypothetical protein [Legionella fallonii]CEG59370.1 conserved protein of unknown function [Legionella fallonii LLAP-10]
MTVTSLRKQAFHLMRANKDGTYKERQRRAFVLGKMINDLYASQKPPISWQDLETHHIHWLVKRWKDRRIKPLTIMRYMTIIRKVLSDLGCCIHYIDNRSLQLSCPKPRKKRIRMSANFWQCLINPAVRLMMALQTHFGLTFTEAKQFRVSIHIQNNQLVISERVIPIDTKEQLAILNEFKQLTDDKSLIKKYGHEYLQVFWHDELKQHKLPGNRTWRYWYAKQRLEVLLPEVGYTQACQMIRLEMGIKSRNTLWLYLNK